MARLSLAKFPTWIEEAFSSDQVENFAQLSRATSIPVATGEHFYGRWEVQRFLAADAIKVVQADPEWCGGVSELVKICTLASAHGVRVIPARTQHSCRAARGGQPIARGLSAGGVSVAAQAEQALFRKDPPAPQGGRIKLPERPGFGIQFDQVKVDAEYRWGATA